MTTMDSWIHTDKKVQELIAEPIANEWKENNNFYQNHLDEE